VTDAIEAVGARAVYLPPYAPDLNRIEQLFSTCARRRRELFRVFCEKFVRFCAPSAPMSA
jgi:transposase